MPHEKAVNALRLVDTSRPFLSHSTKALEYFCRICRTGAILCPNQVTRVRKFSGFADSFFGRSRYVMLSPGFGYIVDNANMEAAFLFSDDLLCQDGCVLHLQPVVYGVCALIVRHVRSYQRMRWLKFFLNADSSLDIYNHPLLRTSFCDYMLEYLSTDKDELVIRDAWGPSAYSEGVIRVLYLKNEGLKPLLGREIQRFCTCNEIWDSKEIRTYLNMHWGRLRVYRQPTESPLPDCLKSHIQILVPGRIQVWQRALIGVCVHPRVWERFAHLLRELRSFIRVDDYVSLPIYCGEKVYSLKELTSSHQAALVS